MQRMGGYVLQIVKLMIFYTRILPLLLLAIGAFLGLRYFYRYDKLMKIVAVICVFNFVSELVGNTLGLMNVNNYLWYNPSDAIRFSLWYYFFYLLFESPFQKKFAAILLFTFPILWILNCNYQSIASQLLSFSFVVGGLFLIFLCFIALFNEYRNTSTEPLFKASHFWITMGLLLYYALNLPFIGLLNWLHNHSASFVRLYFYICVLGSSIILSLFMIKSFLCSLPKKKFG